MFALHIIILNIHHMTNQAISITSSERTALIFTCLLIIFIIVKLVQYIHSRRERCMQICSEIEDKIKNSIDGQENGTSIDTYFRLTTANKLSFDRTTHHRVKEVAGMWVEKYPRTLEAWKTRFPSRVEYINNI
jgi:hypothetical protein